MHVIYRWKSIYVFSETLVRQLSEQMEAEPVNFEFDDVGQAFVLDGERDDVLHALDNLRKAVENASKESLILKWNPAYIPLIQRSRLSEFTVESIVWKEEVNDEDELNIKLVQGAEFSLMKYWSPKNGTDYASMINPREAEDDVPTMIERVCDCRVEKDTFNRRLIIRANDPYVVTRVIEKLDKLEEIFNAGITPVTNYLVYVDDQKDFELKLVSLKAQLRTNGKTTLFSDKQKRYYRDRKEIFTLRLLRRPDAAAKPAVVPLEIKEIAGIRDGSGPRSWKEYLFKGYGAFENDPAVYVKPKAKATMQYPVQQVDLQSHAMNLQRALRELPLDTNDEFGLGPRPIFAPQQNDESLDFLFGSRPNFASAEVPQAALPAAAKRRVKGFEELRTESDSPHMNQAAPLAWPEAEEDVPTATAASSYYGGDLEDLLGPRPAAAPADDFLSTRPAPPTVMQSGMVRTTRRLRVPVDQVPEETKQKVSEASTRVLCNVNSQRKSKKDPIRKYDAKEHGKFNMRILREAFEPSFDYARLHKCRITFEARIGRVIYDTAPPPTKCMNWEDFLPILDDRRDTMKVFFTDRVTTDFVDVDYVNDLKLDHNQKFFNYAADKKKIWYEFLCDYKGKPCLIKFDAETREMEALGKLETYGTVMWNCPLRSWDARFILQARKVLNNEDPTFSSLSESLFIPHDCRLPQISFRTEANSLMVKKIYCKRESRYYVLPTALTGPKRNFEFCVTEVQDLWIQAHTASDETFKASATERIDMIANERLFYTFSLTPSKHEEAFQAQAELEIGEVAQWTGSSMLGPTGNGVIEAMTKIITALIERMDDVGYNNQGAWTDGF